jgi:hypothetical protein
MLEVFGPVYTADELLEAFPPPPDEPSMNGSHDTAGEPPVALDAYALRVWAGEDPKYKDHSHEVDRSGTLMRIGRTLFDAGATRAGIVPALAERDETLEYHKYTERRDADKQYNAIVDELEKSGRNPKVKVGAGKDSLMPDPVEFPTHVLPKSIATYIEEAARSIGCPADFIALPVLASCAAAVGNARVLRIKRRWKEPPIFWFVTVGQPSTKKSPALQEGIFPMVDLELGYKDKHAEKVEEHRAEMRKHKKDAKDARTAGKEEPPEPPKPVQRRVLVNDTTTEAIVSILNDNWRGVLLARDELSGWARGMDQYKQGGRGSDRQFWLSTWSASYSSVDRKGAEGTLYVSKPNINIVGGIQPDILPELGKDRNDGFFERVLVAYPVTTPQMWTEDDVSEEAETAYDNLIWNLRHRIRPEKIGENYKPREAGFATDARKRWAEATNELKRELMNPLFPNRLQGAWGKLEAYLARLALLMAMIRVASGYGNRERVVYANISGDDGDDGDDNLQTLVTLKDLEAAIELLAYFKNHIKRVHAQLHSDDSDRALAAEFYSFLHKNGELWKGSLKDLYGKFPEPKPRINEFAKFIYKEAERNPHLSVVSKHTKTGTHLEIVVTVVTSSPGEAL